MKKLMTEVIYFIIIACEKIIQVIFWAHMSGKGHWEILKERIYNFASL